MTLKMKLARALLFAGALAGCTDGGRMGSRDDTRAVQSAPVSASAPSAEIKRAPNRPDAGTGSRRAFSPFANTAVHAPRRFLRTETAFVTGDAISVQKAGEAIMSREFSQLVRAFERDLAADPEARDLTALYRRAMDEQVDGLGQITELACGLSVCVGAVRTRDDAGYQVWLTKFDADKRTPSYSYGESAVDMGRAGLETRFYFSVDPSLNGVIAPATPFTPPKP